MVYFAQLGLNSKVLKVRSVDDSKITTEKDGINFLVNRYNKYPFWVQTFKDGSKRKNYAGTGFTYDEDRDAFIAPKLFASWILNEDTCQWSYPVPYPEDNQHYQWNEETTSWDLTT